MQFRHLILKLKPSKKRIALLLSISLLLVFLLVTTTPSAHAGLGGALDFVLSPQKAILATVAWIVDIVFWLIAQIVALLGALVDFVLQMDDFGKSEAIKLGWRILRDFANMTFVIILLIMAFATIFGLESYGMKKLLPKLIVAALLINFSLAIAGFIVDFSQYLSRFFIKAGVTGSGVSNTLAHGLKLSRLLEAAPDVAWTEGGLAMGLRAIIEGIVLGSAILLGAAFSFAALCLLLFARIVMISLLLVVSPIVWILWILPATKRYWDRWWNKFLRWVFFAPIYCFFLYLTLVIIQEDIFVEQFKAKTAELQASTSALNIASAFFEPVSIISYVLVIGLLIGGLIVAQKFGIAGAGAAIGLLQKGRGKVTGWAKAKGIAAAKRTGGAVAEKALSGVGAAGIPLVSKAADWGHEKVKTRRYEARQAQQRAKIEKKQKRIANFSDEGIIRGYETAFTGAERAAYLKEAVKRDIVHKIKKQDIVAGDLRLMERYGSTPKQMKDAIIKTKPEILTKDTVLPTGEVISAAQLRRKLNVTNTEALEAVRTQQRKVLDKKKGEIKSYTDKNVIIGFKSATKDKDKAAFLESAVEKGITNKLSYVEIRSGLNAIDKAGGDWEKIIKARPDLLVKDPALRAKYKITNVEGFLDKIKSSEIANMAPESWSDPAMASLWDRALTNPRGRIRAGHLKAIARSDNEALKEAVRQKINPLRGNLNSSIKDYLRTPEGLSEFG